MRQYLALAVGVGAVLAIGFAVKAKAGCCDSVGSSKTSAVHAGHNPAQPSTAPAATTAPTTQPAVSSKDASMIVNSHCPIMGGAIDRAKTPDSLTRVYKGQKVGFCCAGCPAAWDKLSEGEKEAKLSKVLSK